MADIQQLEAVNNVIRHADAHTVSRLHDRDSTC